MNIDHTSIAGARAVKGFGTEVDRHLIRGESLAGPSGPGNDLGIIVQRFKAVPYSLPGFR